MPTVLELFSGTKSIGRAFQRFGWDVISVDVSNEHNPTHCLNLLEFDYKTLYLPGAIDFVWASPPCTEYSIARTTAKRPRDLQGADKLVQITD